jgi:hemin uptake protein HemP
MIPAPQKANLSDAIHSLLKKADLVLHSSDLFGKNGVVLILHENEWYQLKRTRFNKLILNK